MTMTQTVINKMRPSDIRANYDPRGYFFDRDTMRFFGDTMASFGAYTDDSGNRIMYRKKTLKGGPGRNDWKVVATDCGEYVRLVPYNTES